MSNDPEFDTILDGLLRERGGADALTTVQVAIVHKAAKALITDADPRDVVSLLALLPPARPRREDDKPTLDQLDDPGRAWDPSLLDDGDLDTFERLACIAQGRAEPLPDKRRAAALALATALDQAGDLDAAGLNPADCEARLVSIRICFGDLISPMPVGTVYPGFAASDQTSELASLRERLKTAEERLAGPLSRSPNVVPLHGAAAACTVDVAGRAAAPPRRPSGVLMSVTGQEF